MRSRLWLGLALILGGIPSSAFAGCYDVFGCSNQSYFRAADLRRGPNCEFLWTMRNEIYKENGYCFRTQKAISAFGNEGCRFADIGAVPLNQTERANVARIADAERDKGCPR